MVDVFESNLKRIKCQQSISCTATTSKRQQTVSVQNDSEQSHLLCDGYKYDCWNASYKSSLKAAIVFHDTKHVFKKQTTD